MRGGAYQVRAEEGRWLDVNVQPVGDTPDGKWVALAFDAATGRHYSGAGPTVEHALHALHDDYAVRHADGRPRVAITGDPRDPLPPPPDLDGLVRPAPDVGTDPTPAPSKTARGG